MIEHIDAIDGDPDCELHGNEMDGCNGEDEFIDRDDGMGLPGDPDDAEDGHDAEPEECHA